MLVLHCFQLDTKSKMSIIFTRDAQHSHLGEGKSREKAVSLRLIDQVYSDVDVVISNACCCGDLRCKYDDFRRSTHDDLESEKDD